MKLKKDGTISHQGEGNGIYKSENDLVNALEDYFQKCERMDEKPNKAGLRVHLGISKMDWSNYKKRFFTPVKRAEDVIENAWVQRLNDMAATGAIFYLKNAFKEDYQEKLFQDLTTGGKPIPILGGVTKKDVRKNPSSSKDTKTE